MLHIFLLNSLVDNFSDKSYELQLLEQRMLLNKEEWILMLKIQTIKLVELKEYDNNPRLNDEAVDVVANSIKEFGIKVPIIIDKDNIIVAGYTRVKAC